MSLGTITAQSEKGGETLEPRFKAHIRFVGDDSYPTGGTPGFNALVAAALGKEGVNVITVNRAGLCGGFSPVYDPAADTLLVLRTDQVDDPQEEVPNAFNLSAFTFDLLVEYK